MGEQVLRLNGHVVLTKEANVMRGNALEISMATGLARLTSGAPGTTGAASGTRARSVHAASKGRFRAGSGRSLTI